MFDAIAHFGITKRAIESDIVSLRFWNPRQFATNAYQSIDDRPYGGGPGMVMSAPPLLKSIEAAKQALGSKAKVVLMSPQGKQVTQHMIASLATQQTPIIFVAGRYEGIDERVVEQAIDEEWSLGDYILSGGELAAMTIIDATTRLLPGALGHEQSAEQDSFSDGLLDCPHYTRPEMVEGLRVPKVLLSGNHEQIRLWRLKAQLKRTWLRRPDLIDEQALDAKAKELLETVKTEIKTEERENNEHDH